MYLGLLMHQVTQFEVTLDECDIDMHCIAYGMSRAFDYLVKNGVNDLHSVTREQWMVAFAISRIAYDAEMARRNFAFANMAFRAHIKDTDSPV